MAGFVARQYNYLVQIKPIRFEHSVIQTIHLTCKIIYIFFEKFFFVSFVSRESERIFFSSAIFSFAFIWWSPKFIEQNHAKERRSKNKNNNNNSNSTTCHSNYSREKKILNYIHKYWRIIQTRATHTSLSIQLKYVVAMTWLARRSTSAA